MAEATQPQPDPRRRRLRRAALVALAVLVALAALVLSLVRSPALAEAALLRAARARGFDDVAFTVREVGPRHLALDGLRVGAEGELAAEVVELDWSAQSLLAGRFERVAMRGLRVRAVWDAAGLRVPALAPLEAPTDAAAPAGPAAPLLPVLPAREVALASARIEVVGPAQTATLDLDAELRLAASGAPERVRLVLAATPFPPFFEAPLAASADLDADPGGILRGSASAESQDGRLRAALDLPHDSVLGRLSLALHALPLASLAPGSGVTGAADLELEAGVGIAEALVLQLDRCAVLRLRELTLAELGKLAPFELCIEPREEPLLVLPLVEGRPAHVALQLAPAPFELALAAGPKLLGTTPRSVVEAEQSLEGDAAPTFRVVADGGQLGVPGWLAPLALSAQVESAEGALSGMARLAGAAGAPELSARAELAADGDGEISARLAPLRFGPDLPKPVEILPVLRGWIETGTGELSGEARLRIADGALDSDAVLELRDLGFEGEGLRVAGLRGTARLHGWPPRSPGPQTLEIARVESGAAFEDVVIRFELQPDAALDLHELSARGLGGTLRAVGRIQPGARRQALLLELQGLQLPEILRAADVAGLSGEGVVTGATQLAFVDGQAFFEHGQLAAVGEGVLRYRPPGQPVPDYTAPQALDLARAALYDFHYQGLSGTLAGQVDGELALSLRLQGANPALYDGHPVDLELNLKGGLFGLFRSSQSVLQAPGSIERRLRERLGR